MTALVFTPTLGALIGHAHPHKEEKKTREGPYLKTVHFAVHHPGTVLLLALAILIGVQVAYSKFGKGVEFFPNVEPDTGNELFWKLFKGHQEASEGYLDAPSQPGLGIKINEEWARQLCVD